MYRRALHNAKVLEAKRNGGLDLLKTAVSVSDTGKRTKSSARQRFFSFPRWGGRCLNMVARFIPQRTELAESAPGY